MPIVQGLGGPSGPKSSTPRKHRQNISLRAELFENICSTLLRSFTARTHCFTWDIMGTTRNYWYTKFDELGTKHNTKWSNVDPKWEDTPPGGASHRREFGNNGIYLIISGLYFVPCSSNVVPQSSNFVPTSYQYLRREWRTRSPWYSI